MKEFLASSPQTIAPDENAPPIASGDEKREKLTIRLPRRIKSRILTPVASKGALHS